MPESAVPVPIRLRREVMATVFGVSVWRQEETYARQAAQEALDKAERIERRLSRFIPSSDVSQLNRLPAGDCRVVHPDTLECLELAERIRKLTDNAFDVAFRSQPLTPGGDWLQLIRRGCMVRVLANGLQLDLGGIGKGFALDRMAGVLRDWAIDVYRIEASTSSLLFGDPLPGKTGWPVTLETHPAVERLQLCRQAVSASGTAVRGSHIVDPRNGRAASRRRAWAITRSAAQADALSTALLVMSDAEIEKLIARRADVEVYTA